MTTPSQIPAALCGLYPGARTTIISTPKNGVGTAGRRMEDGCWSVRFDSGDFGWWAPEVLSLLLDSPLALCHAARWLATRVGMDPGVTAPSWERLQCRQHCCDGATGEIVDCTRPVWSIMGADDVYVIFADCPDPEEWDGDDVRHVPGISDLTDPAEALVAACVAVGGAS
jgi:hypothetical protein